LCGLKRIPPFLWERRREGEKERREKERLKRLIDVVIQIHSIYTSACTFTHSYIADALISTKRP
jgi:hypothetical protein